MNLKINCKFREFKGVASLALHWPSNNLANLLVRSLKKNILLKPLINIDRIRKYREKLYFTTKSKCKSWHLCYDKVFHKIVHEKSDKLVTHME